MNKGTMALKIILAIVLLAILGNLGFLDWQIVKEKKRISEDNATTVLPTPTTTFKIQESSPSGEAVEPPTSGEENCPQACLLAIDKATQTKSPLSSTGVPSPSGSSMKIFYLPLGSGSTKSQDWADVPGLSSYIDPANYGKVKSVIFEASLRIPTANGKVFARLYNKNDGRQVWFSEISFEGSTSTLIQSQLIAFEPGNKLYQVQAKTTMGFDSFVDFARVKFITE